MTITVKAAREALEAAHLAYVQADIEHPTAVSLAKSALNEARFEYLLACANLIERLPSRIIGNSYNNTPMNDIYEEITGEIL